MSEKDESIHPAKDVMESAVKDNMNDRDEAILAAKIILGLAVDPRLLALQWANMEEMEHAFVAECRRADALEKSLHAIRLLDQQSNRDKCDLKKELTAERAKSAKLLEALEFYGDSKNYRKQNKKESFNCFKYGNFQSAVDRVHTTLARTAIEKYRGGK